MNSESATALAFGLVFANIAKVCHEANRAYCESTGDSSQPKWEDAPEWQKKSAITGVMFHYDNPNAGTADSHNSWLKEKETDGWKYGAVKNPEKNEHPCFVPYDKLPLKERLKDYIFRGIVHSFMDSGVTIGDWMQKPKPLFGENKNGTAIAPRSLQVVKEGATYNIPTFKVGPNGIEPGAGMEIKFCKGDKSNAEVFRQEGVFTETLIELGRTYLDSVNVGPMATRETSVAITKLDEALMWINKRAEDRKARGVQATYAK